MLKLLARRLIWSVLLLFVVSLAVFVLVSLTPGSVAAEILGQNATSDDISALTHKLGLDRPLYVQYSSWIGHAVHGDLGRSLFTNQPVAEILNQRVGATLSLMVVTTIIVSLIGVLLGVLSALRRGGSGAIIDVTSLVAYSLPDFWVALMLVAIFSVGLAVLPSIGFIPISDGPVQWIYFLILPITALALNGVARVAKQARAAMAATLGRDYVRVLLANGMSRWSVIFKHALRNAAIPITSAIGLAFIGLASGTVLVEKIFAIPGIGSAAIQASTTHDLPLVEGAALYFTLIVVVINLLVDLAYGWLNPRAFS